MSCRPYLVIEVSSDSESDPPVQNEDETSGISIQKNQVLTHLADGAEDNGVDFILRMFESGAVSKSTPSNGMKTNMNEDALTKGSDAEISDRCTQSESIDSTNDKLHFDPDFGPTYGFTEINVSAADIF